MGSPPTHVRAATLGDLRARMRSNAKLSAGLKRSSVRVGGHVPPVPGPTLALDLLVVMAVIRNNE